MECFGCCFVTRCKILVVAKYELVLVAKLISYLLCSDVRSRRNRNTKIRSGRLNTNGDTSDSDLEKIEL